MNTISSYRMQSSKRWTNLTLALCLWLVTPPSSKAATETLNGEQKGGGGVDTILDTKGTLI